MSIVDQTVMYLAESSVINYHDTASIIARHQDLSKKHGEAAHELEPLAKKYGEGHPIHDSYVFHKKAATTHNRALGVYKRQSKT